jgi:Ca2+-transporting ATPase
MAVVGVTIAMLSLTSFYYLLSTGTPLAYARTFALTTMVFSQLFNVFNARSEKTSVFRQNPFGNGFLFISVLASFSAQIIFLFVPAMRTVFRNTSLSFSDLIISFAISIMVLIVSELHKLFLRKAV